MNSFSGGPFNLPSSWKHAPWDMCTQWSPQEYSHIVGNAMRDRSWAKPNKIWKHGLRTACVPQCLQRVAKRQNDVECAEKWQLIFDSFANNKYFTHTILASRHFFSSRISSRNGGTRLGFFWLFQLQLFINLVEHSVYLSWLKVKSVWISNKNGLKRLGSNILRKTTEAKANRRELESRPL